MERYAGALEEAADGTRQQERHYQLLSALQNLVKELPSSFQQRLSYTTLSDLALALLDGTVFEIVQGLLEIQHLTEKSLYNQRLRLQNEHRAACVLLVWHRCPATQESLVPVYGDDCRAPGFKHVPCGRCHHRGVCRDRRSRGLSPGAARHSHVFVTCIVFTPRYPPLSMPMGLDALPPSVSRPSHGAQTGAAAEAPGSPAGLPAPQLARAAGGPAAGAGGGGAPDPRGTAGDGPEDRAGAGPQGGRPAEHTGEGWRGRLLRDHQPTGADAADEPVGTHPEAAAEGLPGGEGGPVTRRAPCWLPAAQLLP
uniref:DiGeorge syndrome critical region gene 6 n=1 Tax=Oryctolagus cuniculus TaxID=9986 RepID=G1THW7_RABIT